MAITYELAVSSIYRENITITADTFEEAQQQVTLGEGTITESEIISKSILAIESEEDDSN